MSLKSIRIVLWALVALVGAFGTTLWWQSRQGLPEMIGDVRLGAPFALTDHRGQPISDTDLAGKPYALFFGFTHCPEICPTTLYELSGWLEALGEPGRKVGAYFVTVDPERDTPDVLGGYLSSFEDRITGITGAPGDVAALASAWKVYWKKVPLDAADPGGDYTMDHTASIFLVRADGTLQGTIAFGENPDTALAKLKRLAGA